MENLDDVALQPRIEEWPVVEQNDLCSSCHQADHPLFQASPHALAGLACTDCHAIHADDTWRPASDGGPGRATSLRAISGASATCAGCHQDVEAEFAGTERHRLQEGILECASCHDPHTPAVRIRLGGFKNDQCVTCHADKGGPFVFEHGAQFAEGCTSCHTPHGSPNRHMLKFQSVGELCYSCHALVPAFHFGFNPTAPPRFGLDTNCLNCHSTIHGSNFDPFFLK